MSGYTPIQGGGSSDEDDKYERLPRKRIRRAFSLPQGRKSHYDEHPRDLDLVYHKDDRYGMFERGRDFEPLHIIHKYTEEEKETLSSYNSVDYLPSNSQVYREWLKKQGWFGLTVGRWFILGIIGVCVGLTGFMLHDLIEEIARVRWHLAQSYISEGEFGMACVSATGYSLVFIVFSAFIVVFLRPDAAGSGIPEVTSFLNGTHVRHIFNIKTLLVKFFSCMAAVGCGLPVGPEGPMIHMGALIGTGVSKWMSRCMKTIMPVFGRYQTSEDRRNFASAGAAAGVASAFGAPVGGLLFSMEEVSSFWTNTLSWQIFFCCMIATFTTDLLNSTFDGFSYTGNFGLFKTERYIMFNISKGRDVNILMFIPTVIIGLIGGLLGAVFTILSLKTCRARKKLLAALKEHDVAKSLLRIFEPALIMVIVTVVAVYLPSLFPCTQYTCLGGEAGNMSYSENCLNDTRNALHVAENMTAYTCTKGMSWRESNTTWRTNSTYNEMASLLFGTLENAVKLLFTRDTHFQFGLLPLGAALLYFFVMICWATGTAVASGALVPMLLVGGLYGRFVGRIMIDLFGVHNAEFGYWAWMDPGVFSLIGAASFFGGVTRLNLAVTVIMVEMTSDIQMLLPVMVSVMISKWVGDFFTHPIYHALMELKCMPFLDQEPRVTIKKERVNLELYQARHAMASPVITIHARETVLVFSKLLLNTRHGGFPVVKKLPNGQQCFNGIITRLELSVLLENPRLFELENMAATHNDTPVNYQEINIQKLKNPGDTRRMLKSYCKDPVYDRMYLDLSNYINQSALSIPETFSLQRTYIIFRTLGLRHLTVVDQTNNVVGIITRKDLMGYNIQEKLSADPSLQT